MLCTEGALLKQLDQRQVCGWEAPGAFHAEALWLEPKQACMRGSGVLWSQSGVYLERYRLLCISIILGRWLDLGGGVLLCTRWGVPR